MNKFLFCGISVLFGVAIGTAGTRFAIDQLAKARMPKSATAIVDRKDPLGDVGKGFSSCPITNLTKERLIISVLDSKFTSGTYYVEPKERALLSCRDTVRVDSKNFTTKLNLKKPMAIQFAERVLGTEI